MRKLRELFVNYAQTMRKLVVPMRANACPSTEWYALHDKFTTSSRLVHEYFAHTSLIVWAYFPHTSRSFRMTGCIIGACATAYGFTCYRSRKERILWQQPTHLMLAMNTKLHWTHCKDPGGKSFEARAAEPGGRGAFAPPKFPKSAKMPFFSEQKVPFSECKVPFF